MFALLLALQQQQQQPASGSTPPSRDTVGYWQQRIRYTIEARLIESRAVIRARGDLVYLNRSPDTLREFYVHQYLNAFRPGSRWSAVDQREGRQRFQRLREPQFAYERFTAVPTFDGTPVMPEYPGSSSATGIYDSTVVRFVLPRALAPGDSLRVHFEWEARPSTVPRRQARRGRSYDFSQWFPKVAVYDRGGWEPNALVPAGEFYGEFGDYDVALEVPDDQVIGAVGVPVEGDPGWSRVLRFGEVHDDATAYGAIAPRPGTALPPGYKRVRWLARDVHHFAWSVSPDYRYEGGVYVRGPTEPRALPFTPFDSVPIHVLYRAGDEREWGQGQAVQRTANALRWLEHLYGPYAYPQITNLHRIDAGGTEFPMMVMNGSASQGLILHEGGHIFTFGILANNEWRAGWMDEGLTEFQTLWAQGLTRPERRAQRVPLAELPGAHFTPATSQPPIGGAGYRSRAVTPAAEDDDALEQYKLDLLGRAEPVATRSDLFREFRIYNAMIYTRAAMMYGALRDVMGDSTFTIFLRGYYGRWAFKHVDETAMRAEAERAAGRDLSWFFDQWLHHTGLIDYRLTVAQSRRVADGWVTRAVVVRQGAYAHPMPVGVRTASGWTVVRADPLVRRQTLEIRTATKPLETRLDPEHTTEDWYTPNDVTPRWLHGPPTKYVFDWPFLDQSLGDRTVVALSPLAWYTTASGVVMGGRMRSNYQGLVDKVDVGVAGVTRAGSCASTSAVAGCSLQLYERIENPRLLGMRPAMGLAIDAGALDGMALVAMRRTWDDSPFFYAKGPKISHSLELRSTFVTADSLVEHRRWSGQSVIDALGGFTLQRPDSAATTVRASVGGGVAFDQGGTTAAEHVGTRVFGRAELAASRTYRGATADSRGVRYVRGYVGYSPNAPSERRIYLSSLDPTETYFNHFLRGRDALLAAPGAHYTALGGAGLRGYSPAVDVAGIAALNVEQDYRLHRFGDGADTASLFAGIFGDAGAPFATRSWSTGWLADAGVGVAVRGRLFDRPLRTRLDLPFYVRDPMLSNATDARGTTRAWSPRVSVSFTDLW